MIKKKGVTLVESMVAVSIISLAMLGGMQYYAKKVENEQIEEFVYDYTQIMKGFEEKIGTKDYIKKKYWKDLTFNNGNYNEHLKHNLIKKSSKCADLTGHPEMEKSFSNCYIKSNFKQFNVNFVGSIDFYKNEEFKSYKMTFVPKNKKGLRKIAKLEKALKKVFNNTDFYSDFIFYNKGKEVTYLGCIKEPSSCILKASFGLDYDYLEDEKDLIISDNKPNEWHNFGGNNMFDDEYNNDQYNEDEDEDEDEPLDYAKMKEKGYSMDTAEDIQEMMADQGILLSDKEARKLKQEVNRLKNDPKFLKQMEQQMEMHCSQYDEDDYYFMKLYDKNNVCYVYKTQGLK